MIIGVPKELINNEYRVSITPGGVFELVQDGNTLYIQKGAGEGSGYGDDEYIASGGKLLTTIKEIYDISDLIVKVKEPIEKEYEFIRKDRIIFAYLHLSSNKKLVEVLLKSGATCMAYETIEKNGQFPLLAPMSEVAGRISAFIGAYYLGKNFGGGGILISGISGVKPGNVLILGAGIAGRSAATIASGLGANVTITSPFIEELRDIEMNNYFNANVKTIILNKYNLIEELKNTDILISAVYVRGSRTPIIVTKDMIKFMKKGSVLVAVDIDQGSSIETARPTTHDNPIFIQDGIIHYCVANMPGIFSKTSTLALTNLTLPFIKKIASNGLSALKKDKELSQGLNLFNGNIVYKKVAEDCCMMEYYKPF